MATNFDFGSTIRSQGPSKGAFQPQEEPKINQREYGDARDNNPSPRNNASKANKKEEQTEPVGPAHVAPIPPISAIPSISPRNGIPSSARSRLTTHVGSLLKGKRVDEYGNIVDETGSTLAYAGGDLPSIVGKSVANPQGDILGGDGELLGYVAGLELDDNISASAGRSMARPSSTPRRSSFSSPRYLGDMMRRSNLPLLVDDSGNIADQDGNVVGKFHDKNNPLHRKAREQEQQQETCDATPQNDAPTSPGKENEAEAASPKNTCEEREKTQSSDGMKAQSWRKENDAPSDILLDVKSTAEGVQLTIHIPTIFNGSPVQPSVRFV